MNLFNVNSYFYFFYFINVTHNKEHQLIKKQNKKEQVYLEQEINIK